MGIQEVDIIMFKSRIAYSALSWYTLLILYPSVFIIGWGPVWWIMLKIITI